MRKSGIILHISSLPSPYGIGTMGEEAYNFVNFLKKAGEKIWQVLPIGPTSYGDSPYQSFSTFAGNPYFIDLDMLVSEELLKESSLPKKQLDVESIDYGDLFIERYKILRDSFEYSYERVKRKVAYFIGRNQWVKDYALFMALKKHFNGQSWQDWDNQLLRHRDPEELSKYKKLLKDEIKFHEYLQYLFFKQWKALKNYANEKGIEICGDMPIYIALDSSDVWANSEVFQLTEDRYPSEVAGVPPDYFSEDGQLWGNPIFDWEYLKSTNYDWFILRMQTMSKMFNILRLDHFIGFANYYKIPYGVDNAKIGEWVLGPDMSLFNEIKKRVNIKIIAEDLGVLGERVIRLRENTGYPGMVVVTFAFDPNDTNNHNLPHTIKENTVVYTGTHDNDTTLGWWQSQTEQTKNYVLNYLGKDNEFNIVYDLIQSCLDSKANTAIFPMQDFLGLGSEARMNVPGTLGNNWKWRMKRNMATEELAKKIKKMLTESDRT